MAGHSRWAQVKHKKAGTDAKRGVQFSKFARLLSVATREDGPNPESNPRLRHAVEQARAAGLPKENIERAIARGAGTAGERAEIVEYEAYGPGGCAILARGVTDNPNRTTNEIKHLLDEQGGKLAGLGSVSWVFSRSLIASVDPGERGAEEVELRLIEAGAEDTVRDRERIRAIVPLNRAADFEAKTNAQHLRLVERTYGVIPKQFIGLNPGDFRRAQGLIVALEEHPDITEVITNIATDA